MNATRIDTGPSRGHRPLLQALLAGGGLFLLWRLGRALGAVFWTVFGLAMAVFWTGAWRWLVP